MRLRWKTSPNVVASVEEQTAQAAELARIEGQDRLSNPITNPATRAHADQLRNIQHRRALDAEHGRKLRGHRVADRRAAHAERAIEAIQQAREASSAARSVLALHAGRSRFMGSTLAASLLLSAGAAAGVATLAKHNGAPEFAGWVAEVGFTGMTTTVILYRSHLAQHGGKVTGWQDKILWLLMVAPLAASMAANLTSAGPIGMACSVGAAAFSLLSYVIADASASAIQQQAARVTGKDEIDLHKIAVGDDLFLVPADQVRVTGSETQVPDPAVNGSGTSGSDRSANGSESGSETQTEDRSRTQVSDPNTDQVPDRSAEQVPDPSAGQVPDPTEDRSETQVPDPAEQTQPKTGPKKRTRSKVKPLDRIDEARAADSAYLAEHGRHIPAEKLANALHIGKPAALELVKQVRGARMDIAK